MSTATFPAYADASYLGIETAQIPGAGIERSSLLFSRASSSLDLRSGDEAPAAEFEAHGTGAPAMRGMARRLLQRRHCVFCEGLLAERLMMSSESRGTPARTIDHSLWEDETGLIEDRRFEERIWECDGCGWWKQIYSLHRAVSLDAGPGSGPSGSPRVSSIQMAVFGTLKTFNLASADLPLLEVRRWLARHPNDAAHLDPFLFERLLAECLRDTGQYAQVKLVGGRSDRGIDLILIEGDQQILVQVKRRASDRAVEQVRAVRELNGVLFREGIPRGMVITTAGRFSRGAHQELHANSAALTGVFKRYRVDLVTMDGLRTLFSRRDKVADPWQRHQSILDRTLPWVPEMRAKHIGPYS